MWHSEPTKRRGGKRGKERKKQERETKQAHKRQRIREKHSIKQIRKTLFWTGHSQHNMRHTGSFFEEVQAILERDGRELVLMQQNAHGLILEGLLVLYNEKGNTKFSNFFVQKKRFLLCSVLFGWLQHPFLKQRKWSLLSLKQRLPSGNSS